jgi:nucleoside-diphosphate-sugar epimerase
MPGHSAWVLTGLTGFVGQSLLRRWERDALPINIVALCREGSVDKIQPSTNRSGATLDVVTIEAFLSRNARPAYNKLVHLAGLTKWSADNAEAMKANYYLTKRLIDMVAEHNPSAKFVYCSTAMTQPYESNAPPTIWHGDHAFRNFYELSKFRAEQYIMASGLHYSIVRPPLITGERGSGWCQGYQGLYHLLRLFARGFLPTLPGIAASRINAVPCDDVVASIFAAADPSGPSAIELCVSDTAMSMEKFMDIARDMINAARQDFGQEPIAPPRFITLEQWHRIFRPMLIAECGKSVRGAAAILDHFLPYINITSQNTSADSTKICETDEDYFRSVISFWALENQHIIASDLFNWSKGLRA